MSDNANRFYEELSNEQSKINQSLKVEKNQKTIREQQQKLNAVSNLLKYIVQYNKYITNKK